MDVRTNSNELCYPRDRHTNPSASEGLRCRLLTSAPDLVVEVLSAPSAGWIEARALRFTVAPCSGCVA